MSEKIELLGLSKEELAAEIEKLGEKPFRAKQLWQWIYNRGVGDFAEMSNLSKDFREKLSAGYAVTRPKDRGAVCISTQVGCAVGCTFCHTGSQKLTRNLTAGEIVGQFMVARDAYHEWPSPSDETRYLSNIVVMGMGEPLHNVDNVFKALKIISDGDGIAISKRRITLSSSGIAPQIPLVASELGVRLAISLHAPNDEIRSRIMPINRKYGIEELMKACQEFQKRASWGKYITFEYLLLKDINDSLDCAHQLINLMKKYKILAKFNLIPFNPWPGCGYEPSSRNKVMAFSRELEKAGFSAPVRVARGQDILAACGQLKSKKEE